MDRSLYTDPLMVELIQRSHQHNLKNVSSVVNIAPPLVYKKNANKKSLFKFKLPMTSRKL